MQHPTLVRPYARLTLILVWGVRFASVGIGAILSHFSCVIRRLQTSWSLSCDRREFLAMHSCDNSRSSNSTFSTQHGQHVPQHTAPLVQRQQRIQRHAVKPSTFSSILQHTSNSQPRQHRANTATCRNVGTITVQTDSALHPAPSDLKHIPGTRHRTFTINTV